MGLLKMTFGAITKNTLKIIKKQKTCLKKRNNFILATTIKKIKNMK